MSNQGTYYPGTISSKIKSSVKSDEPMSGLTIAVIPARGGSKGIPLKNLREVGFKPLIAYTVEAALQSKLIDRVVVSTDSERIAEVAKELGAEVPFLRPSFLADDTTPLAAVMKHFIDWCSENDWNLDTLVILEPTSPLRTSDDIDESINLFRSKNADTVISVERDSKMGWEQGEGEYPTSLHPERLNRQLLKPQYKENGAIFVTRPSIVTNETTIGDKVVLYEMSAEKSIDINTPWDMQLANIRLRSVKILFHFKATADLGFGHFYRILALANRLYYNEIALLCSEYDEGLEKRISPVGWKYHLSENPLEIIKQERPAIIINDILDTDEDYMDHLRSIVPLIVNFEDIGPGSSKADLVFNALYGEFAPDAGHYGGAQYAILREEFMFLPKRITQKEVKLITVTFGGSDPNNIALHTMRTLPQIYKNIDFRFIIGPGYGHDKSIITGLAETLPNVLLIDTATNMAKHLSESDIVITSGGRTVFETAACSAPCIVICQNQRELTHRHITSSDGVISLGLFDESHSMEKLVETTAELIDNPSNRSLMSERSSSLVDGIGIFRIIGLIEKAARMKGITKIL